MACFGVKCSVLEPSAYSTPFLYEGACNHRIDIAWIKTPQEIQNEYGLEAKENFKKKFNEMMQKHSSKKIYQVTKAYLHAITSKYPSIRYQCGFAAKFELFPLRYLPEEICDFVIQMFGMCGLDEAVRRGLD
ncbi:hypothetical protein L596_028435 [Steinernema carpocapsae]|nr:hypothetical protein L596_028435 [Steinernema carpocapsae]